MCVCGRVRVGMSVVALPPPREIFGGSACAHTLSQSCMADHGREEYTHGHFPQEFVLRRNLSDHVDGSCTLSAATTSLWFWGDTLTYILKSDLVHIFSCDKPRHQYFCKGTRWEECPFGSQFQLCLKTFHKTARLYACDEWKKTDKSSLVIICCF